MLSLYKSMLAKKRAESDVSVFRLVSGVEKLVNAENDVEQLEANLKVMVDTADEKGRKAAGG